MKKHFCGAKLIFCPRMSQFSDAGCSRSPTAVPATFHRKTGGFVAWIGSKNSGRTALKRLDIFVEGEVRGPGRIGSERLLLARCQGKGTDRFRGVGDVGQGATIAGSGNYAEAQSHKGKKKAIKTAFTPCSILRNPPPAPVPINGHRSKIGRSVPKGKQRLGSFQDFGEGHLALLDERAFCRLRGRR